ncbi:MAG: T9SS type A sorting domain-containing protein [Bacteroidetes bacterium]|uniref:T9SS type A sorting domain-containing protein n=1 Tax=Flavobacterium sp. TaxID=239 RepID=UPI002FD963B5|nr:T9SS type A sorting domain-containing protein [Bacteroidota bacterium]
MKKITLFLFLFAFSMGYSQTISFTDPEFKAKLLLANGPLNNIAKDLAGNPATIDTNGDNEIQVSEALQISYLSVVSTAITNFQGIEFFTNLTEFQSIQSQIAQIDLTSNVNLTSLTLRNNNLSSIDLTTLSNLILLDVSDSQISNLNLDNLTQLQQLYIYNLPITNIDFSNLTSLIVLYCYGSNLVEIDLSNNLFLNGLYCGSPNLTYVNIKNGWPSASQGIQIFNSPNLSYLCGDESELGPIALSFATLYPNCNVGTYCSFNPGGTFYTLTGTNRLDSNQNGCDVNDISIPNLKFDVFSNTTGSFYANSSGNFSIPFQAGNYFVLPKLENPTYFNISPSQVNLQFPDQTSPYNQDFCITPNGVHYDLEIIVTRLKAQIPGADVPYKIIFKNKGNQIQSGTITLNFDDAIMDFVSSNPVEASVSTNQLTWNYSNLNPFETREIEFIMNLNSPMETPALNNGDRIQFTGNIQPENNTIVDDFPADNDIAANFNVVNSADPNDITCLEGNSVGPNQIGKYVHYMIRFENIGTANAMNVVVKNLIDTSKFDIATLVPLYSNYDFVTKQTANQFEFIFENINLPFDDANNDGYLVYKVKLKNNLTVGTTFTNQANIYFDYNFPIVTNIESTTIEALSASNFEINDVVISPNPTSDFINIQFKNAADFKTEIYDIVGKQIGNFKNTNQIDVSNFNSGIYIIKITDFESKTVKTQKFIKK